MSETLDNNDIDISGTQDELPELEPQAKLALIEALLFASGVPLSLEMIASIAGMGEDEVRGLLAELSETLRCDTRGLELVEVAHKFQLRTKPLFSPFLRALKAGGPRRLSGPALETLSIVAYRQPIVKSDIEKIRGVDATPTLKTLLERNLIRIIGHQPTVGQPALYGTTDEFLTLFGLRSLEELPTLRDIRELESEPGEAEEQGHYDNSPEEISTDEDPTADKLTANLD